MTVPSLFSVFKRAMGPSSSHTLGALRAGLDFRRVISLFPAESLAGSHITIDLLGSFALTGKGHLTDVAAACGLRGYEMAPGQVSMQAFLEEKMTDPLTLRGERIGFEYPSSVQFITQGEEPEHPNTIRFQLRSPQDAPLITVRYISYGGGNLQGPLVDHCVPALEKYRPVTEHREPHQEGGPERQSPLSRFSHMDEILDYCTGKKMKLHEFALLNEEEGGRSRMAVYSELTDLWSLMEKSIEKGLTGRGQLPGRLGLQRRAASLYENLLRGIRNWRVMSEEITLAAIYAIGVGEENASGSLVVTAPTCGSAGVVPAVFKVIQEKYHKKKGDIVNALLTAGLFGAVALKNASVSGAYVGCQGEIGVASSMAAAGAAALLGGNIYQVEYAAEVALEHHLGLTCDPIDGLVQIPCIERNAAGAVAALNAVNLALLTDGTHNVSYDSVLDVMIRTGRDMNAKYKETSRGGLATAFISCPNIPYKKNEGETAR